MNSSNFNSLNGKLATNDSTMLMLPNLSHNNSINMGGQSDLCDTNYNTYIERSTIDNKQLPTTSKIFSNLNDKNGQYDLSSGNLIICNNLKGDNGHHKSTVYGSSGNDIIGSFEDRIMIDGEAGNDTITNFGRDNILYGSNGNDIIINVGSQIANLCRSWQ